MAVERDESSIVSTLGAAALLDVVVGLQAECDSQGLRMLQRFMEARRVAQLINVSGWVPGRLAGAGCRACFPHMYVITCSRSCDFWLLGV